MLYRSGPPFRCDERSVPPDCPPAHGGSRRRDTPPSRRPWGHSYSQAPPSSPGSSSATPSPTATTSRSSPGSWTSRNAPGRCRSRAAPPAPPVRSSASRSFREYTAVGLVTVGVLPTPRCASCATASFHPNAKMSEVPGPARRFSTRHRAFSVRPTSSSSTLHSGTRARGRRICRSSSP